MDGKDQYYLIVYRNTGHKAVSGLGIWDLKNPYNAVGQLPVKYEMRTFKSEAFSPVLAYRKDPVVGELKKGSGRYVLCCLKLDGMLSMNPPLAQVFDRLL